MPAARRCRGASRLSSLHRDHRPAGGRGDRGTRGERHRRPPARIPSHPSRARPLRVPGGGAPVGAVAVLALLSVVDRRRGRCRRRGAAVYFAFAVTVLANFQFSLQLKGVALGASIVVAVGVLDDVIELPARVKLAGQVGGAVVAMLYGVTLHTVPSWVPGFVGLNVALTLLWFLTVTNAVQFLDRMDGLAAGPAVIAGVFFSMTALQTNQRYLMFLSAALVGACLGFLPFNFRPGGARIFLGDSGASFIGFTLAGLAGLVERCGD